MDEKSTQTGSPKNVRRILIVDDEPLIRRSVGEYLSECGYDTVTAADGAEGLARARSEPFDLVLVDLRMPRVDGIQVISALHLERPDLPVVVVSGTGVLDDAVDAMRKGAWDYVTKPVMDMDELVVVVERVLEKAQLLAERDRYQEALEALNQSLEAEVARQTRDLRQQNRELAALNQVSRVISDPLEMDAMLSQVLDAAIAAVGGDGGLVRLLNPATNLLSISAVTGFPSAYPTSFPTVPVGHGLIGQVAERGVPVCVQELENDPWLVPLSPIHAEFFGGQGFSSYLCVPLRTANEIVGTLEVGGRAPGRFEQHALDLLAGIGSQIGVAVARIRYAVDLERSNTRLEQLVAELRRLDTMREQFIQNVAHELRTPLALVYGYVSLLAQGEMDPERQRAALDVASQGVTRLVELVESITTLQDLVGEPLNVAPIVAAELLETAGRMVDQHAHSAGVELAVEFDRDLAPFPGDFTRLAQALHQLLDNACKFSPAGGRVGVCAHRRGSVVQISVSDQGIGIPRSEHANIFERFYQVDGSTTRRFGGTGLGLAITKEIVEAHGGQILVESDGVPGRGTTFTILLPASRARL